MEQATFRVLPATQNDVSDLSFGEYSPGQDTARDIRGSQGEISYAPGDDTSLGSRDYRYNILVLPDQISNLNGQNKVYFEPPVSVSKNYNIDESTKAELRSNNDENAKEKDDFNGQISKEPQTTKPIENKVQRLEEISSDVNFPHPIENKDRSFTEEPPLIHLKEPAKTHQYQYEEHPEEPSHDKQFQYEPHLPEPSLSQPYQYEPHHSEHIGEHHNPGQQTSYAYNYHVNGYPAGPIFSKQENSDGYLTRGEYSVQLPDGRTQTVSYSVKGEGGFTVNVRYSGKDFMSSKDK